MDIHDKKLSGLLSSIETACSTVTTSISSAPFNLNNYSYDFVWVDTMYWMEFFGYTVKTKDNGELKIISEIFRAVCYQQNVIFIENITP